MEMDNRIIQGNALYDELFRVANNKFNPRNLRDKIIQSDGIVIQFQEFKRALGRLSDKKSHGIDGMPVIALKRMGYIEAFREFT